MDDGIEITNDQGEGGVKKRIAQTPQDAAAGLNGEGENDGENHPLAQITFLLQTPAEKPEDQRHKYAQDEQKRQPSNLMNQGGQKGLTVISRQQLRQGRIIPAQPFRRQEYSQRA